MYPIHVALVAGTLPDRPIAMLLWAFGPGDRLLPPRPPDFLPLRCRGWAFMPRFELASLEQPSPWSLLEAILLQFRVKFTEFPWVTPLSLAGGLSSPPCWTADHDFHRQTACQYHNKL